MLRKKEKNLYWNIFFMLGIELIIYRGFEIIVFFRLYLFYLISKK